MSGTARSGSPTPSASPKTDTASCFGAVPNPTGRPGSSAHTGRIPAPGPGASSLAASLPQTPCEWCQSHGRPDTSPALEHWSQTQSPNSARASAGLSGSARSPKEWTQSSAPPLSACKWHSARPLFGMSADTQSCRPGRTSTTVGSYRPATPAKASGSVVTGVLLPVLTDHLVRIGPTRTGSSRLLRHKPAHLRHGLSLPGVIPNPKPFTNRI